MSPSICRALVSVSLQSSRRLCKPPIPYSSFLFSFSTSIPKEKNSIITIFDYLVAQQCFSAEFASNIDSSTTKYLKNPKNADSVLSFLNENGLSQTHIETLVRKMPEVLCARLEKTVKPKFKMFQDMGVESTDRAEIISLNPWILTRSIDKMLGPSLLALRNVLGSSANVSALLKKSSWFFHHDLERTLIPNIEYLKSCGVCISQIFKYLYSFPRFFLQKPATIEGFVKRADELGVDRKSKAFIVAVRVVGSMTREKWENKLKLLREMGLSEEMILGIIRRVPQALAVSEKKIKQVTQLLLTYQGVDISYIASNPELLFCSVNQRLKPRLEVIKFLESKNLLNRKPALLTVCKVTNVQFSDKFVIPYSHELGDLSWARMFMVNNLDHAGDNNRANQ